MLAKTTWSVALLVALILGMPTAAPVQTLNLAPGSWARRPAPKLGEGPAPRGNAKHIAIAVALGKTWWLGGDYSMPDNTGYAGQSGRNELWSLSAAPWEWTLETAACTGQPQPNGPDEVGWSWDAKRKLFWMVPGFMWNRAERCPTAIWKRFMSFDPVTKQWAVANRQEPPNRPYHYNVLDPVTDAIYAFGLDTRVQIYHLATDTWNLRNFNHQIGRTVRLEHTRPALDVEGRTVYALDRESPLKNLYAYHIDRDELIDLGPAPFRPDTGPQYHTVWDSTNRVLFAIQSYGPEQRVRIDAFHPDRNEWEPLGEDIVVDGVYVRGVNPVFDPSQNVLILGGTNTANPEPYFFLYRYGPRSAGHR